VTGELSPRDDAGLPERRPDGTGPELRASHEDRDRVVDALRIAAGDGRLSSAELDERLEAALTARTYRELAVLTADLPAAPGAAAPLHRPAQREVVRMNHLGGNGRQVGQWMVPKRMEIQVKGGNVLLDFTEAIITSPTLQIDAHIKGGNFTLITRPGVSVDASEVTMKGGGVTIKAASGPPVPAALVVEITGDVIGGNIRARGRRRTFWQWLLRRAGS
jgi:hypothetical protein